MNKNTIIIIISISIIVLFAVLSNDDFLDDLAKIELAYVQDVLSEDSHKSIVTIRYVFDEYEKTLELGASSLGTLLQIDDMQTLQYFLKDIEVMGDFDSVELLWPSGLAFSSSGIESNVTEQLMEQYNKTGNAYITDVQYNALHSDNIISITLPLENNGEGYFLKGNILVSKLGKIFERSFSGEGRYFHLIDGKGEYVATTNNEFTLDSQIPFFAVSELLVFDDGYTSEQVYADFQKKIAGLSSYSMNNERRYMYYEGVGINDWILTTIMSAKVAEKTASLYRSNSYIMVIRNTIFLSTLACIILMQARKSHKKTKELQEYIEALAVQTNKVIFEWDYKKEQVIPHSDYKKVFGENFTINDKLKSKNYAEFVHKDDKKILLDSLKSIKAKGTLYDVQMRIKVSESDYIWCSVSTKSFTNKSGKIIKTLGFVENIQEITSKTEELKRTAELDLLTGLYNKVTTERFIAETLLKFPKVQSALFIIDLDNFKTLNDTLGHIIGDEALQDIAKKIKALFRQSDIIGRVGGDEFFVFIQNHDDVTQLEKKARLLCSKLRSTYSKKGSSVEISFSVGIALFPEHGDDCESLYVKADEALYGVKKAGKGGYCIYGKGVNFCTLD